MATIIAQNFCTRLSVSKENRSLHVNTKCSSLSNSLWGVQRHHKAASVPWMRSLRSSSGAHGRIEVVRAAQLREDESEANPSGFDARFDVSSNCVSPVFRATPWAAEVEAERQDSGVCRVLFLSEGNVCRSPLAEAMFRAMVRERKAEGIIECASKATKNYNEGEEPDYRTLQVAADMGVALGPDAVSTPFDHVKDIVFFDLILVMDKFNAADVLKEVSVYDTIHKGGGYSLRVRRLGEFARTRLVEDIDDPLYFDTEDEDEMVSNCREGPCSPWAQRSPREGQVKRMLPYVTVMLRLSKATLLD
eukprot:jgi/Mesvir1/11908/Mv00249-RA.3